MPTYLWRYMFLAQELSSYIFLARESSFAVSPVLSRPSSQWPHEVQNDLENQRLKIQKKTRINALTYLP